MNKRIRKKLHRGEFTVWGRRVVVLRNREDGFDEFIDSFVEHAIEANGCHCGGGGAADRMSMVIELGMRRDDPDTRFRAITSWLDARPDVKGWQASAEVDLWHECY